MSKLMVYKNPIRTVLSYCERLAKDINDNTILKKVNGQRTNRQTNNSAKTQHIYRKLKTAQHERYLNLGVISGVPKR